MAVGWQVFRYGDPFDLGLVLSQFLPFIVLILPAGHVADRYHRPSVQLLTYLLADRLRRRAAGPVARRRDGHPADLRGDVLFGVVRAFSQPTSQWVLPNLAPLELFPRAVAVNSSLGQVATIAGPAVGGVLVLFGVEVAYALSLFLLVIGVVLVAGLRGGGRRETSTEPVSWATLLSGVAFVRSRPILGAISLDLFAVLLGGAVALLPIFAARPPPRRPVGPRRPPERARGRRRATVAIGSPGPRSRRPRRRDDVRGGPLFGIATIVFGVSTSFPARLAALPVLGAADMVSVVIRSTLIQIATPDEMRGRVSAVNMVFIGASNELGEFESGVTAAWLGPERAVVVGGVGTLVVGGLDQALPGGRGTDWFPSAPPEAVEAATVRRQNRRVTIDPVAFQVGPIQVHWYGIIMAAAVFVAGLLGTQVARW